jgi:hypothetical protein
MNLSSYHPIEPPDRGGRIKSAGTDDPHGAILVFGAVSDLAHSSLAFWSDFQPVDQGLDSTGLVFNQPLTLIEILSH